MKTNVSMTRVKTGEIVKSGKVNYFLLPVRIPSFESANTANNWCRDRNSHKRGSSAKLMLNQYKGLMFKIVMS